MRLVTYSDGTGTRLGAVLGDSKAVVDRWAGR